MFLKHVGSEIAGCFDELGVVEKHERLGRAVGATALNAADFERWLVEDDHVVLRLGAAPVTVEGAPVDVIKVTFSIVDRVVRFHRWAAAFVAQEPGSEKSGIADCFAGETVGRAAGEELVGDVE